MKEENYYESRIIKAVEYLNRNLAKPLRMEDLAKQSHFSSFHFQRIYKSVLDESPYETILRLRLEKSVFLIKHRPHLKLAEIAIQSGFETYENFSRQFKNRFNCSPSQYKKDKELQNSRIYQENLPEDYYHHVVKSREIEQQEFTVKIESLETISIAFVRAMYGADGSGLVDKYHALMDWVKEKGIPYQGERRRFGMSIDQMDVTPSSKFRYDFAINIENRMLAPEKIIEIGEIPGGEYATVHCKGKLVDVAQAWDYLYKFWLPNSQFEPKHFPAVEEFVQGPEEIGWEDFNVKCRIPIQKMK